VGIVLVRPGAAVKRGEVLGTLDCRNASALSREIAAKAKAIEEQQAAAEKEASAVKELSAGGFASTNEAVQLTARAASEKATAESLRASLISRSLEVDDCVLRAPFAGEVAERLVDPGAFVRPGEPVVTVIDRATVRVVADAPESDFAVVAPGAPIDVEVEATGAKLTAQVSRRAPAADEATRTVRFEVDLSNGERQLPVGATARLAVRVGAPQLAIEVPLRSATVRAESATLYLVGRDGRAERAVVPVLGEQGGALFLAPKIAVGAQVITEGRALLDVGDRLAPREAP
jgi:RND family efflux transporter MFP subunit